MINLLPLWLRRAPKGEEIYLVIPRSVRVLLLCGMAYGKRDPATGHIAFMSGSQSNCIFYAMGRYLGPGVVDPTRYLLIRRSRINWGICHVLYGTADAETGQIRVWSYKPPPDHEKPGVRPFFEGRVVEGDSP